MTWLSCVVLVFICAERNFTSADQDVDAEIVSRSYFPECRFTFMSPLPGEQIYDDQVVEVEIALIDCLDHSSTEVSSTLFLNGKVLIEFRSEFVSFEIPQLFKGFHVLFVHAAETSYRSHQGKRPCNATMFLEVVSRGRTAQYSYPNCSRPDVQTAMSATFIPLGLSKNFEKEIIPFHWVEPVLMAHKSQSNFFLKVLRNLIAEATGCGLGAEDSALLWIKAGWVLSAAGKFALALKCYKTSLRLYRPPRASDARILDICGSIREVQSIMHIMSEHSDAHKAHGDAGVDQRSTILQINPFTNAFVRYLHSIGAFQVASLPESEQGGVAYAIVSGRKLYSTRARAVAETWLTVEGAEQSIIYGDEEGTIKVCPPVGRCYRREIRKVVSNNTLLQRVADRDDFFSSLPKFVLSLIHLRESFPHANWFFVAGCDAYVVPHNLAAALSGLDPRELLLVGGHAGLHGGRLFLSGGAGLAFSKGLAAELALHGEWMAREWLEVRGGRQGCAPCADVFFADAADRLGAMMVQRAGFYAFWPHYYAAVDAARALSSTEGRGRRTGPGWSECSVEVEQGGLGVSGSAWWGRTTPLEQRPVSFHYLQPRAMRLLHRAFVH